MGISQEEWDLILAQIRMTPLTAEEKKRLLAELSARYGRELTPEDFIKAGAI